MSFDGSGHGTVHQGSNDGKSERCCSPIETTYGSFTLMDDDEFEQYLDTMQNLNFLSGDDFSSS